MKDDDLLASVGTTLSAIAATISAIYSIPLVSSLFTFLVGAFVTFLVQSRLQDRAEKRKLRVKAIEELHIPLYLKLEEIKEKLLLNLETVNIGSWNPLFDKPQMFTLKPDFKSQTLEFFKSSNKLEEQFNGLKGTATEVIFKNAENRLLPTLIKKGLVKPLGNTENIKIDRGPDSLGFSVVLKRQYWSIFAPILSCALLNRDPIIYLMTTHKAFEMDRIVLSIRVDYFVGGGYKAVNHEVDLIENSVVFGDFWKELTNELADNTDIGIFNRNRQGLIPICDMLLISLKKHINRYIEIEKNLSL
jgi:hypothetical protein